jgi:RNA polymerase sigma-70 factor (ECF subfamily)
VFLEDHPGLLDTADDSPTPEDRVIGLDNQAAVNQALDQLQPPLREVLLLCDVEELKYKDIAAVLDVPIGTVMSRISRARRALHQQLQAQFGQSQFRESQ